jgi:hypothetical protein
LDETRRGTHLVAVDVDLHCTSDYSCLGFYVGLMVGNGVPVFTGFRRRPSLDELDALGAALATSGGVAMFIVPGVTPPFATAEQAFGGVSGTRRRRAGGGQLIYERFCTGSSAISTWSISAAPMLPSGDEGIWRALGRQAGQGGSSSG